MPAPHRSASWGATDFLMASAAASVLFLTTACGAVVQAEAAPAPATTPETTSSASASATALPMPKETSVPEPSAEDTAPLDPESAPDPGGATPDNVVQPAFAATALELLATLPIKGRAPKTGYSREQFGQAWADVDRNGCDTRNDILARDLADKAFKPGTRDCVVLTGVLADPYTATTINFVRGAATSSAVQIDHVVALNDAWQKGAQQLSLEQRTALGNDPLNLLAVDGPSNQSKGAGDAATWLPPNKAYRCDYVARQISVKASYALWVTQAEHDAMTRVLAGCIDIAAPSATASRGDGDAATQPVVLPPPAPIEPVAPVAPAAPVELPAPAVEPPALEAPAAPAPLVEVPAPGAFYQNCDAVRAAGASPIRVGDPGFQPKFDRDGDGVGCE